MGQALPSCMRSRGMSGSARGHVGEKAKPGSSAAGATCTQGNPQGQAGTVQAEEADEEEGLWAVQYCESEQEAARVAELLSSSLECRFG